jgi:hypothetical protein
MSFFFWSASLLLGICAVAVAAGKAALRGQRPWVSLAIIWLGVALPQDALARQAPWHSLASALVLLAPLGVAALAAELEVQRGCSVWRAGSLGVVIASATGVLVLVAMQVVASTAP